MSGRQISAGKESMDRQTRTVSRLEPTSTESWKTPRFVPRYWTPLLMIRGNQNPRFAPKYKTPLRPLLISWRNT